MLTRELGSVLDQSPGLEPDPEAMAQVVLLMAAGTGAAHTQAVRAEEAGAEGAAQSLAGQEMRWFKLFALLWAALALAVYWAWPTLTDWMAYHPYWVTLMAIFGGSCLLTPLLLLPGFQGNRSMGKEGGRLSC